jgi:radical SAM superfamily enzyme YgiQ (UPF0313 family)
MAKEQGIPAAVNSSDATDHAAEYLAGGFDYVILGEPELTVLELASCLPHMDPPRTGLVRGLALLGSGSGQVRRTPPRDLLKDLDRLPDPAWDLVPMANYRSAWRRAHGYFALNMVASRGCPFHCNWCAKPIYGQTYHARSPQRVAGEMRRLKNLARPDRLWFADDIFALSPHWTAEFAAAVEALDARIPFKMQSRCDLMTAETVAALARAGCAEVWMGAESGSQRILDAMDKGLRLDEIRTARENLRRHGIRVGFFLQFGYPGETWEDIERTIHMVRETEPDDIGVSVSYPLPGTKFYDRVAAQLGIKKNWSDSDDLAMMFRGTYTGEFYRALHDALHFEVDWRRGLDSADGQALERLWTAVRNLRESCANPDPTPSWISS